MGKWVKYRNHITTGWSLIKLLKKLEVEFFIKQNTSLPILKMDVIRDGRTDSWKNFYEILDNANIRFSMKSEDNGIQKIFMQPAYLTEKDRTNPDSDREYYIYYKWSARDTNKKGRFIGEFLIVLENGELISPIVSNLYINII